MKKPADFPYNTKPTLVVFRRWRDAGHVVALFPCLPEPDGRCSSFTLVGEHAALDYAQTLLATEPASAITEPDVRALAQVLIQAPHWYHLKPYPAAEIVVLPGAREPLTRWQLCQYVAAHSVEATPESIWDTHSNLELVVRYNALTREKAGEEPIEA